ncbi:hypothetical protein DFR65_10584 [Oceanihabitans sediminis]|nr:hypothetical protein DFR65_10584 [Oceanihabitans sediminis]
MYTQTTDGDTITYGTDLTDIITTPLTGIILGVMVDITTLLSGLVLITLIMVTDTDTITLITMDTMGITDIMVVTAYPTITLEEELLYTDLIV